MQPLQDPEEPITRPDVSFVADDGNWDTWLWSKMPWSAPRGPDDLVEMEEHIDGLVGPDGLIGDFNLIGHGVPGLMSVGHGVIGDPSAPNPKHPTMDPDQLRALQAIAGHMAEDSEIVLGGCNFGADPESLRRIAEAVDQTVVGGKAMQLPFPGIEGTEIRAIPSDIPGMPPTLVEESSWSDPYYDVIADMIGGKKDWKRGLPESAQSLGASAMETATNLGQQVGQQVGLQAGVIAPEPVLPPIELSVP
ncbi:MAG: hypothetical protein ACKV2T_16870 [Kofleriaceae bacterium]